MNLGDQCVLVVRGLIALGLGHRATQLVQWHLLGAVAHGDAVHRNGGAGGDALDIVFLTIHRLHDATVFAFADQVDAVHRSAAPDGILGLRVDPHRFLREVKAGFLHVAQHADGGTRLAINLLVADCIRAAGEHHGGQQNAEHDGGDHGEDPGQPGPLDNQTDDDHHDYRQQESTGLKPRQGLVFLSRVLVDLDDLLDCALLLRLRVLFRHHFFLCWDETH